MIGIVAIVLVLAVVLLLLFCMYYNEALQCEYYTIEDKQLPRAFQGTKIVMPAELH